MNNHQNEEQLLDRFNKKQKKITQNRLILTTTLNFLTLVITIFSMTYYQWASVSITLQDYTSQYNAIINSERQVQIWLNLIFMKVKGDQTQYQTYASASDQLCSKNDLYCLTIFYQYSFIGGLCFTILFVGVLIQIFQFSKLTYFLIKTKLLQNQNFLKSSQFKSQNKSDFTHIVAISTYSISISLNVFGLKMMDTSITLQVCFWLQFSTLLLFILVIVYSRIQMTKIQKQNMILSLISQQKNIHDAQWEQRKRIQSIEMSSDQRKSQTQFGI